MKFGQPLLTSELSGSVGGITASSSRGGVNYFRVRTRPANPRTLAQTTIRLILTTLAAAWTSILNTAGRAAWAAAAPANSSGIDAYVKSNSQILRAGQDRQDIAPASLALVTTPFLTAVLDASAHTLTLTGGPNNGDDIDYNVYLSTPQSPSRLSQQFPFRFAGTTPSDVLVLAIPTTHPAYNATAGQAVYARIVQFGNTTGGGSAGRVATEQDFRCIVVP